MDEHAEQTASAPRRRWGIGSGSSVAALRFYYHFARIVGRVLAYFCTGPALLYTMLFVGTARRTSMEYLTLVLGPAGWPVRVARSFRHIFNFAAAMVDRTLLLSRGPETFTFVGEHIERMGELAEAGKGGLVFSSHLGNTELASAVLPVARARFHQVMADPMQGDLQEFLMEKAGDRFPPLLRLDGAPMASLQVLRAIRSGDLVGMKVDRVVDDHHAVVPFLGRRAAFPTGPWILAAITGAPVMLIFCMKEGGKGYRIVCEPPRTFRFERGRPKEDQLRDWVAWFAGRLESYVRRYPYQWYNFYDFFEMPPAAGDGHGDDGG